MAGNEEMILRRLWSIKLRNRLILDLANLKETDCAGFWEKYPWLTPHESNMDLLVLRDELRHAWGNLSGAPEIDATLRRWLAWQGGPPAFVAFDPMNTILPNPANLRVTLAFALIDEFQSLGTCGNPKCPRPFFLRSKLGQRFCQRKTCLAYGQREHKLRWWRVHRSAAAWSRANQER